MRTGLFQSKASIFGACELAANGENTIYQIVIIKLYFLDFTF